LLDTGWLVPADENEHDGFERVAVGISILNALALLEACSEGADFSRTLTLGRLDCFMGPRELRRVAAKLPADSAFVSQVRAGALPAHMDEFLRALGARELDVLDASPYEGANVIHDLNEPLPASLVDRYDAIIDGGTLEHVFNLPVALRSVMTALTVGGRYFALLPANNQCGHGFYQFSAELFYRVFSPENGFEVERLLVSPSYAGGKWLDGPAFDVADPAIMRGRVFVRSRRDTMFLVQARKASAVEVFAKWPQQSDYAVQWALGARNAAPRRAYGPVQHTLSRAVDFAKLAYRMRERRYWSRIAAANPALTPHQWKY
jgi:hypothetical protein